MRKSFSVVSAAFCLSVIATQGWRPALGRSSGSSQSVTGTQLGSPQEPAQPGDREGGPTGATVTSNQANQTYPATVGPTGSTQPDAPIPTALSHLVAVAAAKTDGYVRNGRSSRRRRPPG